jgi:GNAT superfamily N-acetyltransferase
MSGRIRSEYNAGKRSVTTIIRLMTPGDADGVRRVEAAAFGAWLKRARGRDDPLPWRTRTNVLALREKDPDGCFVAEHDGRVVGLIFSCTWGSVGWFGTFAVLPEFQGWGIGKELIGASLDYLRRRPGRMIGLETMPGSADNLGLYLKRGFQPRFLTIYVHRPLDPVVDDDVTLPRWSRADDRTRDRWLAELREVTDRIRPGLDYSKEIISTARHRLGETLFLIQGGRAVGACTVTLVGIREGPDEEKAPACPLVLHPAYTNEGAFHTLLVAAEALARAAGKQEIMIPVNARHTWALERVLRSGFRVERALVRMVLMGTDTGPCNDNHVDLSRWAG